MTAVMRRALRIHGYEVPDDAGTLGEALTLAVFARGTRDGDAGALAILRDTVEGKPAQGVYESDADGNAAGKADVRAQVVEMLQLAVDAGLIVPGPALTKP